MIAIAMVYVTSNASDIPLMNSAWCEISPGRVMRRHILVKIRELYVMFNTQMTPDRKCLDK